MEPGYVRSYAAIGDALDDNPNECLPLPWITINDKVLSSDLVLDCDESVVFDAAARWLAADSPSRAVHAPEVSLAFSAAPCCWLSLLSRES